MARRARGGGFRSKYGVRTNVAAVQTLADSLHAGGLSKKEALHEARLQVYSERVADGILFASKHECHRYQQLRAMELGGIISDLKLQVPFPLHTPSGSLVGKYVCDFQYVQNGTLITEDAKGSKRTETDLYRWKKKHVFLEHGIVIREFYSGR